MKGPLWALVACTVGVALVVTPTLLARMAVSVDDPRAPIEEEAIGKADFASRAPRYDRPTWAVGDSWLVAFGEADPVCRAVVAQADVAGYRHGVWCPEDALADYIATQSAAFELIHLGRFTPDLGGRYDEDSQVFAWYDWPLSDGKTWTSERWGVDVDVTANWDPDEGRYVMVGEIDGERWATWDYVPATKWWSRVEYASGWAFQVVEFDRGWELPVTLADTTVRFADGNGGVVPYGVPRTFTVAEDDDALYVWMTRGDEPYAEHVELRAPDGRTMYQPGQLRSNVVGSDYSSEGTMIASEPGQWTIVRAGISMEFSNIWIWGAQFTRVTLG